MVWVSVFFCHCWYFLEINFRFQPEVSDDCYDLLQKAMSFNVEIVSVTKMVTKFTFILFLYMSKDEAINLLRNTDLTKQRKYL